VCRDPYRVAFPNYPRRDDVSLAAGNNALLDSKREAADILRIVVLGWYEQAARFIDLILGNDERGANRRNKGTGTCYSIDRRSCWILVQMRDANDGNATASCHIGERAENAANIRGFMRIHAAQIGGDRIDDDHSRFRPLIQLVFELRDILL